MLKMISFVEPFTCRWQFSCARKQSHGADAQVYTLIELTVSNVSVSLT